MADEAAEPVAEAPAPKDWQPQQVNEEGVYLEGESGLPANHRLRAEALARSRRKSDPDGLIPDELIADTAERLRGEREAEAAPARKVGGKE